jgi:glycosyltransferase involved in cell wall biosynthesis
MRILYHLSHYISHRASGEEFVQCLRSLGHEVVHVPEGRMDLAIIHDDPLNYAAILQKHPHLGDIPRIAYAVWEGTRLPDAYASALQGFTRIWTPSTFSAASMSPRFPNVRVLPHVVRRRTVSAEDRAFAEQAMGGDDAFTFFTVVDTVNPRKNLTGLLGAFSAVRRLTRRRVRLVVKQYRLSYDLRDIPDVRSIDGDIDEARMAACYAKADAYVSAHHAEGWGLCLSEAMAYGKPVVATGWSGNMDFMDAGNSFPMPYALVPVSEEVCRLIPLFQRDMVWAEVDRGALVDAMRRLAEGRWDKRIAECASDVARRFGPQAIAERMAELLQDVACGG